MASTMGSGDMPVFATPAMVALMENAAMNAVAAELEEGSSTVGVEMSVSGRGRRTQTDLCGQGVGCEGYDRRGTSRAFRG